MSEPSDKETSSNTTTSRQQQRRSPGRASRPMTSEPKSRLQRLRKTRRTRPNGARRCISSRHHRPHVANASGMGDAPRSPETSAVLQAVSGLQATQSVLRVWKNKRGMASQSEMAPRGAAIETPDRSWATLHRAIGIRRGQGVSAAAARRRGAFSAAAAGAAAAAAEAADETAAQSHQT